MQKDGQGWELASGLSLFHFSTSHPVRCCRVKGIGVPDCQQDLFQDKALGFDTVAACCRRLLELQIEPLGPQHASVSVCFASLFSSSLHCFTRSTLFPSSFRGSSMSHTVRRSRGSSRAMRKTILESILYHGDQILVHITSNVPPIRLVLFPA